MRNSKRAGKGREVVEADLAREYEPEFGLFGFARTPLDRRRAYVADRLLSIEERLLTA